LCVGTCKVAAPLHEINLPNDDEYQPNSEIPFCSQMRGDVHICFPCDYRDTRRIHKGLFSNVFSNVIFIFLDMQYNHSAHSRLKSYYCKLCISQRNFYFPGHEIQSFGAWPTGSRSIRFGFDRDVVVLKVIYWHSNDNCHHLVAGWSLDKSAWVSQTIETLHGFAFFAFFAVLPPVHCFFQRLNLFLLGVNIFLQPRRLVFHISDHVLPPVLLHQRHQQRPHYFIPFNRKKFCAALLLQTGRKKCSNTFPKIVEAIVIGSQDAQESVDPLFVPCKTTK